MKEYLLLLTKYNHDANSKVVKILENLSENERKLDRKSFYVSLHGLLDHIAASTLFFQRMIKASFPEASSLSHKYLNFQNERGKMAFPDFNELKAALTVLDNAFIEFANTLSDEDVNKPVAFPTPSGMANHTLSLVLFKFINHGTHHRGQISQILDELNIDNDFSGIAANYD